MLCYFPSPITLSCSDSPVFIWFKSQISSCPHPTAGSVKSDAKSVGSHKSTKSMSSQKSTKSTKSLSSQKSEFCYHCAVWEMVWMFEMSCRYLTIDVTNLGRKFSLNRLPFWIAMNNVVALIAHSSFGFSSGWSTILSTLSTASQVNPQDGRETTPGRVRNQHHRHRQLYVQHCIFSERYNTPCYHHSPIH